MGNDVKVILDSKHNDILKANILGNFLSCTGGSDSLQGNGGKDTYVIDSGCSSVTINNYDPQREFDLVLLKCPYKAVQLRKTTSNDLRILCEKMKILLYKWFESPDFQHLYLKTSDKVTAFLPENDGEFNETNGFLFPVEIESDEDCKGESRHIDLTTLINRKVERFTAKTDACSFTVTGNSLNNYIDPGPDNPYGYQELKGGNGSDTYVIGHNYGIFNTIDNNAEDGEYDHLLFNVLFHDIKVYMENNDAIITSLSRNDSVRVTLLKYFEDESYQHILIHSVDDIIFVPSKDHPYMEVKMMDFTKSSFSQVISAKSPTLESVKVITGSLNAENSITGGEVTVKITGGNMDDTILGGPLGEDLIGLAGSDTIVGGDGSDYIFGGEGNDTLNGGSSDDVIYGGLGGDTIDGGEGSDYIVFSGLNFHGVRVNLQIGYGWSSDAEGDTYTSIENVLATEYDDDLFGSNDDNFLIGYSGDDFFVPYGGNDVLQGGRGNDYYYLTNAYGRKVIDNFATDLSEDLVILNKSSSADICYFLLEDDLDMRVKFEGNNPHVLQRIQAGEDFLHIKLSYVQRNTTYQHISFLFSDQVMEYPSDFDLSGKQLFEMYTQITSGYVMSVSSTGLTSLRLEFNLTSLVSTQPLPSVYKLEYVHITTDSEMYHTLNWPSQGGMPSVDFNNVQSGVEHRFMVVLSSCGLTVAISPLVSLITQPSPPVDLKTSDITFDGFKISWAPPKQGEDPNVKNYQYVVTISRANDNEAEVLQKVVDTLSFTTFDLVSETVYHVSVASRFNVTTGPKAQFVTVKTDKNNCVNLQNLPFQLKIGGFVKKTVLIASLYCVEGYTLIGPATVTCSQKQTPLPECRPNACEIPVVANADIKKRTALSEAINIDCSNSAFVNCEYTWECKDGYEFSANSKIFSSKCQAHRWTPTIKPCVPIPSCKGLKAPKHGRVSSPFVYVDQYIHYTCLSGYERKGQSKSQCVRGKENLAYLSPQNLPMCSPIKCPQLLPQPNGIYSTSKIEFLAGDTVTLTCNKGYYIRNVIINPERKALTCLGGKWDVLQTHCMRSIQVTDVKEDIFSVSGVLYYSFSSWSRRAVGRHLYGQACNLIGGKSTYSSIERGSIIRCNRIYSLVNGPNQYTGFLSVSTAKGDERVCVTEKHIATEICKRLGFSRYTSSVFTIAQQSTSLKTNSWSLVKHQQNCGKGVRCRATCPDLNLIDGNDCVYTLEGDTCRFSCRAGYLLVGSSSRKCTGSGSWTGEHPLCDGEFRNKYLVQKVCVCSPYILYI